MSNATGPRGPVCILMLESNTLPALEAIGMRGACSAYPENMSPRQSASFTPSQEAGSYMAGTELKTDSSRRWMMYSKDAYGSGRIFLSTEQKHAVEEGKTFSQRAYADIWAKDAALVTRVRAFLGANFHWHDRLAKSGTDLHVIQTLQSMIRGDSVVLIAEQSRAGGSTAAVTPAPPAIPSFRETLMTEYAMSYDAATDYIERYNASVDRINGVLAQSASRAASVMADDAGDLTDTTTPLGDAEAFTFTSDTVNGDAEELAASTNNPNYAAKMLGYDRKTFGDILHVFKPANGLGPADNVIWHDNGDVYRNGNFIANFHDWAD